MNRKEPGQEDKPQNELKCRKQIFFRATPAACGGSQARGQIGALATGLRHSHSNARSEPRLQPTTQPKASEARDRPCVLMDTSLGHSR